MAKKIIKGVGGLLGIGGGKKKSDSATPAPSVASQLAPIISQLPADSKLRRKPGMPQMPMTPNSTILRDTLGGG